LTYQRVLTAKDSLNFRNSYIIIKDNDKWTLNSGRAVEDIIFEKVEELIVNSNLRLIIIYLQKP
jgi:hypothetical protein